MSSSFFFLKCHKGEGVGYAVHVYVDMRPFDNYGRCLCERQREKEPGNVIDGFVCIL